MKTEKDDFYANEFTDLPTCNGNWNDVTDVNYSNTRTKSFKIHQRMIGDNYEMLHTFSAGNDGKVSTKYHVILENLHKQKTKYYCMSPEEILLKFELNLRYEI